MKIQVNNENLELLIKGSSIFTTGGGISSDEQIKSLKGLSINTEILSIDEFKSESFLCTVGELGPSDAPPLKKGAVIKKMLDLLEKTKGVEISGIFPPEIGQESVVLECATLLNLPIADFDPVGFRAVPFFDLNIFNLKKMDFDLTPIVISNNRSEIFLLEGKMKQKKVEKELRNISTKSNEGVIFLMGQTIQVKELLKNKIGSPSYSKALDFGSQKSINKLIKKLQPKKIMKGRVVNRTKLNQEGFFAEEITLSDDKWELFSIILLNEAIFLKDSEGKIIHSVPDRILLIDPNEIQGISGANLEKNTSVIIAVIDPEKEWTTKRAEKIFGKNRFKTLLK